MCGCHFKKGVGSRESGVGGRELRGTRETRGTRRTRGKNYRQLITDN
ncbi:hypothetical protein [Chroococcidiopsis thermalis]|nr:hypothetical protein [Chroococcidiopsis thermalis]